METKIVTGNRESNSTEDPKFKLKTNINQSKKENS